jgi:hypothetical protein
MTAPHPVVTAALRGEPLPDKYQPQTQAGRDWAAYWLDVIGGLLDWTRPDWRRMRQQGVRLGKDKP